MPDAILAIIRDLNKRQHARPAQVILDGLVVPPTPAYVLPVPVPAPEPTWSQTLRAEASDQDHAPSVLPSAPSEPLGHAFLRRTWSYRELKVRIDPDGSPSVSAYAAFLATPLYPTADTDARDDNLATTAPVITVGRHGPTVPYYSLNLEGPCPNTASASPQFSKTGTVPDGWQGDRPTWSQEGVVIDSPNPAPLATEQEASMSARPSNDPIYAMIQDLAEQVQQVAKRQEAIAEAVSEDRQAFASLFQQMPPQFPMSGTPAMPPQFPGSSFQPAGYGFLGLGSGAMIPAPPSAGYGFPAPMAGGMYPPGYLPNSAMLPLVRRDIRKVVMHGANGSEWTLAAVEVITTSDPLNNTETQELITHRYTNDAGEPLDHARPLYACYYCGDLTNDPARCRVCGRPMCQRHTYAEYSEGTNDGNRDLRCINHPGSGSPGLLASAVGLLLMAFE